LSFNLKDKKLVFTVNHYTDSIFTIINKSRIDQNIQSKYQKFTIIHYAFLNLWLWKYTIYSR